MVLVDPIALMRYHAQDAPFVIDLQKSMCTHRAAHNVCDKWPVATVRRTL
jgi:hypothetical protein